MEVSPVERLGLEISASVKCWPLELRRAWEAAYRAECKSTKTTAEIAKAAQQAASRAMSRIRS